MSFMAGRRESGDLIWERQGKGNFSDFKRLSSSVEGGRQSAPRLTPGGQVPFDFFQVVAELLLLDGHSSSSS